ncbi:MAG: hypothetical protein IKY23_05405 [Lachnospiraceae bacterium]|nr:hypothetical protein [Lachnospiraceae bacterium]
MFLDYNKVYYLSLFEDGNRIAGAGFLRLSQMGKRLCLEGQIRCDKPFDGVFSVTITIEGYQEEAGKVRLQKGRGQFKLLTEGKLSDLLTEEKVSTSQAVEKISTSPPGDTFVISMRINSKYMIGTGIVPDVKCCERKPVPKRTEEFAWEELKKRFEIVYPFGDERAYVTVGLKDLHLFKEGESKLSHNSFLLHGYYNYRHLIVGKDRKAGNQSQLCHYLGVPGVFYEKEKMAAVMFGFEAFECNGPVTIGKYGYYLRQIEILE